MPVHALIRGERCWLSRSRGLGRGASHPASLPFSPSLCCDRRRSPERPWAWLHGWIPGQWPRVGAESSARTRPQSRRCPRRGLAASCRAAAALRVPWEVGRGSALRLCGLLLRELVACPAESWHRQRGPQRRCRQRARAYPASRGRRTRREARATGDAGCSMRRVQQNRAQRGRARRERRQRTAGARPAPRRSGASMLVLCRTVAGRCDLSELRVRRALDGRLFFPCIKYIGAYVLFLGILLFVRAIESKVPVRAAATTR